VKIAITADLHLNPKYPERGLAFQDILRQLDAEGIPELIIAGDLFDKDGDDSAYASFLDPCRAHPSIRIHLIPGNHDSEKSLNDLALENLQKYQEPKLVDFDGLGVFFVPYQKSKAMGEMINLGQGDEWEGKPWVLVGHGDFVDGLREPNPREKGIYMPLRKSDLNDLNLKQVFLGHIHKPTSIDKPLGGKVMYPGSPQGLDISETGHRRFLVLDSKDNKVSERRISSGPIYLDLNFFVFPSDQEAEELQGKLERSLADAAWESERERFQLRLRVEGFTRNKDQLIQFFTERLQSLNLNLYESSSSPGRVNPDFDSLLSASDPQRNLVARRTIEKIDLLFESSGQEVGEVKSSSLLPTLGDQEPTIEQVKMAALRTIYQV
jgi:exonuclease SbcD